MREDDQGFGKDAKRIPFKGRFTAEIRELFAQKRRESQLSYEKLGARFGVHWSTVRNWEKGTSKACHDMFIIPIAAFLNGEGDGRMAEKTEAIAVLYANLCATTETLLDQLSQWMNLFYKNGDSSHDRA